MKSEKRKGTEELSEVFSTSTEAFTLSISQLLGQETPRETLKPTEQKTSSDRAAELAVSITSFSQVTLHRESAGRGGKTVTLVTIKPQPSAKELEALAKLLRKGLGCGSHVEESRIILQGDIPDRAQEWFAKKGARKVVRGN